MRTPEQGAATPTYLALSPEVSGVTGKYFDAQQNVVEPSQLARDLEAQDRLWHWSLELVGIEAARTTA
jgi:hypothetical protein